MPAAKATIAERGGALYLDDDVELFFLPPQKGTPLQFAVNPLGTVSDNFSFGRKGEWQAAAQRGNDRWTAEFFVPYDVLGMTGAPAAGFALPVQIGRQEKPKGETTAWSPCKSFNDTDCFGNMVFQ